MEDKLVALLDNVGLVELFYELVSFLLNAKLPLSTVYQDNKSVITLINNGGSTT
jgi:hypothetical protein